MDACTPGRDAFRVAVVEDDVNLALLLRYNLQTRGHAVTCITDGAAAWVGLIADPPDAVILDWGLPSVAGIEILRRMRASECLRDVPVLMLTARCLPEDRSRAFATGANAFLAKPFSVSQVVETLGRLILSSGHNRGSEMFETWR